MVSKVIPLQNVPERAQRILVIDGGQELKTVLEQCRSAGLTSILLTEGSASREGIELADSVVEIGRTQLDPDTIIRIAKLMEADAVHTCATGWVDDPELRAACESNSFALFDCAESSESRR